MGFPYTYKIINGEAWEKNPMNSFTVSVNDKLISVKEYKHSDNLMMPEVKYDGVMVCDIYFQPNEIKQIRCTFDIEDTSDMHGGFYVMGKYNLGYILKSGKTWSGNIDSALIKIYFLFPIEFIDALSIKPDGFTLLNNDWSIINYVFHDFRPEKDIAAIFTLKEFDDLGINELLMLLNQKIETKDGRWINFFINQTFGIIGPPNYLQENPILYDVMRKALFIAANYCYSKEEYGFAIHYYKSALTYEIKKLYKIYNGFDFDNLCTDETWDMYIEDNWNNEKATDAPTYFCAYNIACCYALIAENKTNEDQKEAINEAFKWLSLSLRMNKSVILYHMKIDSDLKILKRLDGARYEKLMANK